MIKTINKHGQSLIEYALITVLVVMGTVVMGPYVLRSVNGHFKLWDQGVHDSFTEGLVQAPPFSLITNCTCQSDCSLGTPATATSPATPNTCPTDDLHCGPGQFIIHTDCIPQGCNNEPSTWVCQTPPTS